MAKLEGQVQEVAGEVEYCSEKQKRTACVSPDIDEVESANTHCKLSSHSQTVHPPPGIPVPCQPRQSIPAPETTRKRSRDVSCSEGNDKRSTTKQQYRRCPSPTERFEKEDSGREADDAIQKVVEQDLKFDNANSEESAGFADMTASFVAPEAVVVPETLAAPEARVVLEPPTTPETRSAPDAPEIPVDTRESEGASPLGFLYGLTAEELGLPEYGDEMTMAEFVRRDLEQMDCEVAAALEVMSTPQETEEVAISRHGFR